MKIAQSTWNELKITNLVTFIILAIKVSVLIDDKQINSIYKAFITDHVIYLMHLQIEGEATEDKKHIIFTSLLPFHNSSFEQQVKIMAKNRVFFVFYFLKE
jgi:hypothetical protein